MGQEEPRIPRALPPQTTRPGRRKPPGLFTCCTHKKRAIKKKAAPKSGFFAIELRLVRSSGSNFRSGFDDCGSSVNSSRSGVNSSGSSFRSGVSSNSNFRCDFGSGFNSSFFFLTTSGQGNGSDQRSQQERLFHAFILNGVSIKPVILEICATPHIGFAQYSAADYTVYQANPYSPSVVGGNASCERCKITSTSPNQSPMTAGSRVHRPRPTRGSRTRNASLSCSTSKVGTDVASSSGDW